MPSPFPGMDPYVEAQGYFNGIHASFITYLREAIQGRLPEPYYAEIADRTWVEMAKRHQEPDVNVLRAERPSGRGAGGIAVAEQVSTTAVVIHVPHLELREHFLDIFARFGDREQLVTTVEVLSQSNKTPGEGGRDLYLKKQREVLEGNVHLVEIDLLRAGKHSTAVPLDYLKAGVKALDYHVCIHHFDSFEDFHVYPIQLADRLPTIGVPLLPGDGAVPIDLQTVFDRAYDTGPYRRRVRYTDPVPTPALSETQQAWAQGILRHAGLLPPAP